MKFISTRDTTNSSSTSSNNKATEYTLRDALLLGYAPNDGGLFVPSKLPTNDLLNLHNTRLGGDNDNNDSHVHHHRDITWWSQLSYEQLTVEVLWMFCKDDLPSRNVLEDIVHRALTGFECHHHRVGKGTSATTTAAVDDTVPVIRLRDNQKQQQQQNIATTNNNCHVYVSELFWGPTFCFKDLGMRVTIGLLEYFASQPSQQPTIRSSNSSSNDDDDTSNNSLTLVVSTTGDTGPACVQAVADLTSSSSTHAKVSSSKCKLGLVVHYPVGQISEFQRRQLTTASSSSDNGDESSSNGRIRIVSYEGGGDDMDRAIKNIMTSNSNSNSSNSKTDPQHQQPQHIVCGVNSYNIGRPLMQMVHFIWTYLRVVEQEQDRHQPAEEEQEKEPKRKRSKTDNPPLILDIIIPTGAMGNVVGCYMAKQMGVPIGKIICGVNINDTTYQVMTKNGQIQRPPIGSKMYKTLSDAINIQLPYNLERVLYYLTNGNHQLIHDWYATIEGTNSTTNEDDNEGSNGGVVHLNQTVTTTPSSSSSSSEMKDDTGINWFVELQKEFESVRVTDDELCTTMRFVYDKYNYLVDPHTGVAFRAAQQLGYIPQTNADAGEINASGDNTNNISRGNSAVAIIATAAPCKFEEAVTTAMGQDVWNTYYDSDKFPASGKELMTKVENQPILYRFDQSKSMDDNQSDWEIQTRSLIHELQQQ